MKIYKIAKGGYVIENKCPFSKRITIKSVELADKGNCYEHVYSEEIALKSGEKRGLICDMDCYAEIAGGAVEIIERDIKIVPITEDETSQIVSELKEALRTTLLEAAEEVRAMSNYPNKKTVKKALHGKTQQIRDKHKEIILERYRKNKTRANG